MFGNLFAGRAQRSAPSFRVISVIRQSGGVTGVAAQPAIPESPTAQAPQPTVATTSPLPTAIDCFHSTDLNNRRRFGAFSAENPDGLKPARGMRPRGQDVPTQWVTVFAGAADVDPRHMQVARALGAHLAAQGWGILYGGTHGGQMGALANAALAGGGWVIGVLPGGGPTSWLQYPAAGEEGFLQTPTLESRKSNMMRPSRGAVALPGGWGTFDEIGFAMHSTDKPVALMNVGGFWDPLLEQTLNMRDENLIAPNNMLVALSDPRTVTDVFDPPSDVDGDAL